MELVKSLVAQKDLQPLLQGFFQKFEVKDLFQQRLIQSKYQVLVTEKNLWMVKLYYKNLLAGSAVLCKRVMTSDSVVFNITFHSQIYIEPEYRGRGYLSQIILGLNQIDSEIKSDASIVISRRAVGELYSKYGYLGSTDFPVISFNENFNVNKLLEKSPINLDNISMAYESTYSNQDSYFPRNIDFWRAILLHIPNDKIGIDCGTLEGSFWYYITFDREVIELACNNPTHWNKILDHIFTIGIRKFKISKTHSIFELLLSRNGSLKVRPEPLEGHMMKISSEISKHPNGIRKKKILSEIITLMKLNVLYFDQW